MIALLWALFGVTIGAAVLHGALGLTRPIDRTYLSFAAIMVFLAGYVYFERALYRASTGVEAAEVLRYQVVAAHGFIAFILVFVPAYTRVRIRPWLMKGYWIGLALLFVANLVTPYGIWFASEPELVPRITFRGVPYNTVLAPPLGPLQYIHTLYVISVYALTLWCALVLTRRGDRKRGVMLAIALSVVIVHHLVDVVRDAVGASWPYVAEFGLVTWGLVMSVQLAIDFRATEQRLEAALFRAEQHAAELAKLVDASLLVRDKLNTPLQTLELGLALRRPEAPDHERTLADLRRAVVELTALGRMVEQKASQELAASADRERAA
jgi:hypothetical protein